MAKINRENLLANLADMRNKKENLENAEFTYRINRHWPGVGCISDIASPAELVNAYQRIHDGSEKEKQALNALNMLDGSFPELMDKEGKEKYYGYTIAEWDNEMKTKRDELAAQTMIARLEKAIEILEKNMSEDDKFNAEMSKIDELLG